jgi:hypothetical protein
VAKQIFQQEVADNYLNLSLQFIGMTDEQLVFRVPNTDRVLVAEVCGLCGRHLNFLEGDLTDLTKAGDPGDAT